MSSRAQHRVEYRRFLELLRKWRTDADLSQAKLAAKLKKPPSYVHKCEVGERRVDPLEFIDWCRACGMQPDAALLRVERSCPKPR
jgi:Helix-turn-helix domain